MRGSDLQRQRRDPLIRRHPAAPSPYGRRDGTGFGLSGKGTRFSHREKDRARFALTSPRIKLRLQLLREALNAAGIVAEVVFADAGC